MALALNQLCVDLFDAGCLKFGEFKLKSGIISPVYVDLRVIVSFPKLLQDVANAMWEKCITGGAKFDCMCGVPYTALPIATVMSIANNSPMVMRRKEVKKYGTKKIIEGVFKQGQTCLLVEDLVSSAMSCYETIEPLNDVGLNVTDVVVLLDREQGGRGNLADGNINLHAVFGMKDLMQCLLASNKVNQTTVDNVFKFIEENSLRKIATPSSAPSFPTPKLRSLTYQQRSDMCSNRISKQLLSIMESKQSNLCVSADVETCAQVLDLVRATGPNMCMLKLHVDILQDFTHSFIDDLVGLAAEYKFLIFEDRKFADIGNTVKAQYQKGVYRISSWAHITNAHMVAGPGIVDGLKEATQMSPNRGLLLLAEMSSKGNLCDERFKGEALKWADEHKDFIIGFISMGAISETRPHLIHMTPGVNLGSAGDSMGQQYKTPDYVIGEKGSDIIIVGRGIYRDENPALASSRYKNAGWAAYLARLEAAKMN